MTVADVKKTMREAMAKASRDLSIAAIVFAAMSLHDVFGFGPERIERRAICAEHAAEISRLGRGFIRD